jgi:translocation and assembly module TamB
VLKWPSGQFAQRSSIGEIAVVPPAGTNLMTSAMPLEALRARAPRNQTRGVFSPSLPKGPVPIGGTMTYAIGPEWIDVGPTRISTPSTYVEIEGRTAYGERSRMPFHVSSSDWQDSDRLFSAILTAFGSRTRVIPVDGYGTFDGVMLNSFRRPRIEGMFAGEQMRAFDVTWGSVTGEAVIENSYADVKNVVVSSGMSAIHTDGRFSLGFPRRDGGEQINAHIRIIRRPIADLKHAFGIDDYDLDGSFSGEFRVTGEYERPFGSGTMGITEGTAYGETFDTAIAAVQLEGDGVRLNDLQIVKGTGRGTGAAFVGWNGNYSFNFSGQNISIDTLALTSGSTLPLSGFIDFTAGGSGTFDKPRYDVRATLRDFFVADEGIGQVVGDLSINGDLLTISKLEAASGRLAVSGGGTIVLNESKDAELTFSVADTSLDPYIRAFQPQLSPYTTARVSGTIHAYGELANIDNLAVETSVDRLDIRFLDYVLRNPDDPQVPGRRLPIRLALDRHSVRVLDMRLAGEGTSLTITGVDGKSPGYVDLHNETIGVRFNGDANLAILEGFTRNVRSQGRATLAATLQGPMRDPAVSGQMTIDGGRIRHFSVPHALDEINGVIRFDNRSINLEELSAELGRGPVQFGGSIGIEGYRPGRIDVTMDGQDMRLRFPKDMTSRVDASLSLQGTVEAMTLRGDVIVEDALYKGEFTSGGSLFDFGGGDAAPAAASTFMTTTLPLTYDVRIRAMSTLEVDNSLMDRVFASADLRLAGTYDRPTLLGTVDVERGEIVVQGRRYRIARRGSITFNNPTKIEPYFDIETETLVRVPGETYRITARAQGIDPLAGLTFSAVPELPQWQLLALLFSDVAPGRDIELGQYASITPQEQLLREYLGRALTGRVSSEISRTFQEALAVDTFNCTTSLFDPNQQSSRLDPGARCTIGKRLSDRVFLTYSRSLASATRDQVILLEFDQNGQLSWILSRNEDGTYALDVRVRRSF